MTPPQQPAPADTGAQPSNRKGLLVVGLLFLLGSAMGVFAFFGYRSSERFLGASLAQMHAEGANRDVEQCVDAVLDWNRRCEAMKSLCEASAPRLMDECLSARDRTETCRAAAGVSSDTRFGYEACAARNLDRAEKKTCAMVYRAIDAHCKRLRTAPPAAPSAVGTRPARSDVAP